MLLAALDEVGKLFSAVEEAPVDAVLVDGTIVLGEVVVPVVAVVVAFWLVFAAATGAVAVLATGTGVAAFVAAAGVAVVATAFAGTAVDFTGATVGLVSGSVGFLGTTGVWANICEPAINQPSNMVIAKADALPKAILEAIFIFLSPLILVSLGSSDYANHLEHYVHGPEGPCRRNVSV